MLGKLLLTADAIALLLGAVINDYNYTHIFNPRWPPHAKFHGAQTLSLSIVLGLATLYYTWRSSLFPASASAPPTLARQLNKEYLNTALLTGTIYWLTGLGSILFPGTDGIDPEFGTPGTFPQLPVFSAFAGLGVLGWLLETWNV
ncbi:hypothetical protein QBC35DRAFT_394958 [Podospora australis]|uniref:Uncharacterized protein n=1 Tax=Podospora australis TaxID=1536484 RepID=A0AAN7AD94_9PEZI|nr:hypothetical protein QBC35DRAFT_394958 [Podospora australis]